MAVVGGVLLVLVVSAMVSIQVADRKAEREARGQVASSVALTRDGLTRAAADGDLVDTEIRRAVAGGQKSGGEIRRDGRRVTVTVRYYGFAGVMFGASGDARGCYRFEVVPAARAPSVSMREVPYDACRYASRLLASAPADVAEDVSAELRTAVATGGVGGARTADVWRTPGVRVQDIELTGGRLVALVWLSGAGRKGPAVEDCYEFRVTRDADDAVSVRKLKPDGCYRLQR
ncbi:hypothetical protein FNH08_28230 [Streptomyces spongiae]|uniref:Uncharacterized protein n=1 Tax=Streptomyces spongiae TaxID=565072 RepID=A0A5N8XNH1_9ACTN|nr:hypothetical protein [Streptomyces spongiae]